MASYFPHMLIDQTTGEFDWTYIKRHALLRAQADFGAQEVPVSWVRDQIRHLRAIAFGQRQDWRRDHGLPDDAAYVLVNVPTWGASGDGFGAGR